MNAKTAQSHLQKLVRRLYTENRMSGDEMRNAAQDLEAVMTSLFDRCTRCGEPADHFLHLPASQCADCKAPHDHHPYTLEIEEA